MGFFDKSAFGQFKDMMTKGPNGIFNEAAREQVQLMNSMQNPDGTTNMEAMAQMQQQGRDALTKAGTMSVFGKKVLAPDVLQSFQQMSETAFARQRAMSEMLDDHQRAKAAAASNPASANPPSEAKPE